MIKILFVASVYIGFNTYLMLFLIANNKKNSKPLEFIAIEVDMRIVK